MCVWVQTVHPDCLGVSPGWRAFSPSGCVSSGRRRWCWPHRRLWRGRGVRLSFRRAPTTYEGLCWPLFLITACTPHHPDHIHLLLVTLRVLEDVSSIHRSLYPRVPLGGKACPCSEEPCPRTTCSQGSEVGAGWGWGR